MDIDLAQLIAIFIEATLYGTYLVTYGFCVYRYLRDSNGWKPLRKVDWPIFSVASTIWVLLTVNVSVGMLRAAEALITKPSLSTMWIAVCKTVSTSILILLADSVMVWRFWVVYQKSLVATSFPAALWLACLGFTAWSLYLQVVHSTRGLRELSDLLTTSLQPVCSTFWALTLALNLYTTGAIVLRIWRVERDTTKALQSSEYNKDFQQPKDTSLHKTMKMIIDSGCMYALVSISVVVSQFLLSNAIFITSAIDIIVIGLTFNLIALRIASRHRREESNRKQRSRTIERSSIHFTNRLRQGGLDLALLVLARSQHVVSILIIT
ncbi:hypothetical protein BKA70DRAFT_824677 [Coprinopsis sp. MPI-PUGE-AT-0042]|nr:hypothetical protein BKA70DRAFT_824677 [Coprinopsis sp. MPI-PUGE-AT-0042]